jgi:glycosyltransferase involved in cell wall biosynthesis
MGFQKIVQGAYCCDIDKFAHIHKARPSDHWSKQEKTLFFVGRYAKEKFVLELQRAFITIVEQYQLPWRLICAGTGPLWEERVIHARIEHLGFLQPQDLLDQMALGHAFILPSVFEPWGVVVHEFAAAGLPLILSDKVGARTAFLNEPKNGFSFTSGSELELKSALEKLMRTSNGHLFDMSQQSYYLAQSITPDTWSKGVLTLLEP